MIEMEMSRITIRRGLSTNGRDLIVVEQEDRDGENLPVVEALGLLQFAIHDVLNQPKEES